MDIKRLLADQIQAKVKDAVVKQYGLNEATADTAVGHAMTAVLSGLKKNASSEAGAAALNDALAKDHDGSVLSNVDSALGNGTLEAEGVKILGHVFGAKTGTVAATVGTASGTDTATAGGILSTVAPLVLGQLGKTKQSGGLDATGIADTLLRQELPKGGIMNTLTSLLDRDGDGQIVDDVISMGSTFFKKK